MAEVVPFQMGLETAADTGHLPSVRRPVASAAPGTLLLTDSDEDLLVRVGRGDRNAVTAFIARKMPRLLSLGRRLLGDAAEAEDVAQETLVRTWKQANAWVPGKARIDTWMHRVALNLCYDRLRRRRDTVNSDDVEIADSAVSAHVRIERAQNAERLQAALNALPERQRVAITLCYYQELSNIEAAALMEVSVEALESLLARARRALRTAMSEPVEDAPGDRVIPFPQARARGGRP